MEFLLNREKNIMDVESFLSDQKYDEKGLGYIDILSYDSNCKYVISTITGRICCKLVNGIVCDLSKSDTYRIKKVFPEYFPSTLPINIKNACLDGDIKIIQSLIDLGEDLNEGLIGACEGGHICIVNWIIEKGADDWNQGLLSACLGGNFQIVLLMIEKLKDSNKFDDSEWNEDFFQHACEGGNLDIIKLMIQKGANNWDMGLCIGCNKQNYNLIKLMIEKGATAWDEGLEEACGAGTLDIVKLMIQKGANNWNDSLERACYAGHIDIVKLIIEKGATTWDKGLQEACKGGNLDIVKLMIHKGARNLVRGLKEALRKNHSSVISYLTYLINTAIKNDFKISPE